MGPIVSNPDPGEYDRPRQNGHSPSLVVAELREHKPPFDLIPEVIAEQSGILDEEFAALLTEQDGSQETSAISREVVGTLSGFEALTHADFQICPPWCIHRDLPVHSDGFDANPEAAPHRSVEHGLHPIHGGEGIDHTGGADVTVQLAQERDLSTGPVITLSVVIRGIEQYAWLTIPETRALRGLLDQLLNETDN